MTSIFLLGYACDSTDGMSLFSTVKSFPNYAVALSYAKQMVEKDGDTVLDYVADKKFTRSRSGKASAREAELPDYCNEGWECTGCWILSENEL